MSRRKFWIRDFATLGSILDFQLSWKSGKFQLARWGHRVVLLLSGTGRPPDHLNVWGPVSQLLHIRSSLNFKSRFVWSSRTGDNCHGNICPHIICPGPSFYWSDWILNPDFFVLVCPYPYFVLVCPHPLEYYATFALVQIVTPPLDLIFLKATFCLEPIFLTNSFFY